MPSIFGKSSKAGNLYSDLDIAIVIFCVVWVLGMRAATLHQSFIVPASPHVPQVPAVTPHLCRLLPGAELVSY